MISRLTYKRDYEVRFEQLEQFVALGVLGHFRQAAEQTKISTSALTRSIQTLEEEIGYGLVTRSTRSVKLTPEGEIFLDYAKHTLLELEQTKKRLFESRNGCTDEKLIIGYTNKASNIVPISCGKFLAQYPHVKIEMQLQEQHELTRKLQEGEIDISVYSQAVNSIAHHTAGVDHRNDCQHRQPAVRLSQFCTKNVHTDQPSEGQCSAPTCPSVSSLSNTNIRSTSLCLSKSLTANEPCK